MRNSQRHPFQSDNYNPLSYNRIKPSSHIKPFTKWYSKLSTTLGILRNAGGVDRIRISSSLKRLELSWKCLHPWNRWECVVIAGTRITAFPCKNPQESLESQLDTAKLAFHISFRNSSEAMSKSYTQQSCVRSNRK